MPATYMPFQLSCLAVNSTRWYVLDSSLPLSKCLKKKKKSQTKQILIVPWGYNMFCEIASIRAKILISRCILQAFCCQRGGKKIWTVNMPSHNSINCEIIWKMSPCYFRRGPPFWQWDNGRVQTVNVTCKWVLILCQTCHLGGAAGLSHIVPSWLTCIPKYLS